MYYCSSIHVSTKNYCPHKINLLLHMVSFHSMVAHWSVDVIYINSLSSTHAVNTYADGWQVTDDRCSLCADLWTVLEVTYRCYC